MDPYRTPEGTRCPRCQMPLEVDDNDLACSDGCGRWIPAKVIVKLLGSADLGLFGKPIAHWKAKPFRAASCPVCDAALAEHYMPTSDGDVLTTGFCAAHGAWLDQGDHADFVAAYTGAPRTGQPSRPKTRFPAPNCGKCGGKMDLGFVPDARRGDEQTQQWRAGQAQSSFWFGVTSDRDEAPIPVRTFRCTECGFLESYARPDLGA
jgi:hypothetical protein